MAKTKNQLKSIILLLVGVAWISYIVYWRFIRSRLPIELKNITSYYTIIGYGLLFIMFSTLFLITIKKRLRPTPQTNSKLFEKVIQVIARPSSILNSGVEKVHEQLFENSPKLIILTRKCLYILHQLIISKYTTPRTLYISHVVIYLFPRIFLAAALSVDVLVFQQFYYTYKLAWLITIVIVWRCAVYILEKNLEQSINFIKIYYKLTLKDETTIIITPIKVPKDYELSAEDHVLMREDIRKFYELKTRFFNFHGSDSQMHQTKVVLNSMIIIYGLSSLAWLIAFCYAILN